MTLVTVTLLRFGSLHTQRLIAAVCLQSAVPACSIPMPHVRLGAPSRGHSSRHPRQMPAMHPTRTGIPVKLPPARPRPRMRHRIMCAFQAALLRWSRCRRRRGLGSAEGLPSCGRHSSQRRRQRRPPSRQSPALRRARRRRGPEPRALSRLPRGVRRRRMRVRSPGAEGVASARRKRRVRRSKLWGGWRRWGRF